MAKNKLLITNSALFFLLYSVSLAVCFFTVGRDHAEFEEAIFLFILPVIYLALFINSIRLIFADSGYKSVGYKTYRNFGLFTLLFILVLCGISVAMSLLDGEPTKIIENITYPLVLIVLSLVIFILYSVVSNEKKNSTEKV